MRPQEERHAVNKISFKILDNFMREIGRKWYSNRAVDEWNRLSNHHIVSGETVWSFKRRLDKFMDEDDGWK